MACVNVIAAETDSDAEFLATSLYRMFMGIITNERGPLCPPAPLPAAYRVPEVYSAVNSMLTCTFERAADTLRSNF